MAIDLGDIPSGTSPTTAEKLQIRSAIGVGTTDAPTFLAQTLTGQSLTGTQATSLVDLAATWNTSGTPTAIKLNVVETGINSNAASNLMDLQVGGVSRCKVTKAGELIVRCTASEWITLDVNRNFNTASSDHVTFGPQGPTFTCRTAGAGSAGVSLHPDGIFAWEQTQTRVNSQIDLILARDAAGTLAQRNGTNAQAFRVYNTDPVGGAKEWFEINWQPTGTNSVKIGTALAGGGAARPIDFVTGGVVRMSIGVNGNTDVTVVNNVSAKGYITNGGNYVALDTAGFGWASRAYIRSSADGVIRFTDQAGADFNRLQFGGTTSAFPAIKRNGTGIHIVLADDSGFAPLSAAGITGASFLCSALGGNGFSTTGGGFIIHTAANKLRLSGSADTTGGSLLLDTADVIQVRNLANTAAGFIQGKLRTETAYTATVVTPTGFLTLYDSTGTAYRVPCVV